MYHLVARALLGRLLFCRETDGLALWIRLTAAFPELVALCLMPDHVHLVLPHPDPANRMHAPLSGYARWLNRRLGRTGPLWAERPLPEPIPDEQHLRRTIRYVYLNPCRARLVRDPLAWPFSTHRDRVGFAAPPVVAVDDDPERFHRWVSADGTTAVGGTPLPVITYDDVTLDQVAHGAAAIWRVHIDAIATRHPARATFVRAAQHVGCDPRKVAERAGISPYHRWDLARFVPPRGAPLADPVVHAAVCAAADPRFFALSDADRRRDPAWRRYATRD